jgi:hypothetical protein
VPDTRDKRGHDDAGRDPTTSPRLTGIERCENISAPRLAAVYGSLQMSTFASDTVIRKRRRASGVLAGLLFGACTVGTAIGAEQGSIPNFAPNSNVGWVASGKGFGVDFVQPPSGPGPVTNDPAYPYLTNAEAARTGRQPTYRVADLTNPILKPWVVEEMRKANNEVLAGKIPFTADSRCYPAGVPSFLLFPANPVRFIQTPDQVLMIWQQDAQVRRVHLNQPHTADPKPSWYGESVGHYEGGDTLVVDTIGQNDKTQIDRFGTPHSDQIHVIERYRLSADRRSLEVQFTVDDPGAFTMPWSGRARFAARRADWDEQVCAENNRFVGTVTVGGKRTTTVPTPTASKPDF